MTSADLLARAKLYPLLTERLVQIGRAGWTVKVEPGTLSWEAGATDHETKRIRVVPTTSQPIGVLAHEVGHALAGRRAWRFGARKEDFRAENVRSALLDEAEADVCALEVRDDALSRGLPDPGAWPEAVDLWRAHQRGHLTRAKLLEELATWRSFGNHGPYYERAHNVVWAMEIGYRQRVAA